MAHSSKNLISYVMSHFTTPSLSYIALINYTHFSPHQISSFQSVCVCVCVRTVSMNMNIISECQSECELRLCAKTKGIEYFFLQKLFSLFSCSFHVAMQTHATPNIQYTHTHIFCDTYWPYFKHSIFTRINNYFVSISSIGTLCRTF